MVLLALSACGANPEERLLDRWQEVSWSYEKIDGNQRGRAERIDGIRFRPYADRPVVRHEAEFWEFAPDRRVDIVLRDGQRVEGRWRLKGRGHVLTIRYGDGSMEVYDVKELDDDRLVLNSDLGMEVRGIARLEFRRVGPEQPLEEEVPERAGAREARRGEPLDGSEGAVPGGVTL